MADINQKAAEFRANAEVCGLPTERGPLMSAYVTNSINGDGTNKYSGERDLTAKQAACMKIPGSVDEPIGAVEKWTGILKKEFQNSVAGFTTFTKDVANVVDDPQASIKAGQKAYDNAVGSGRVERALDKAMMGGP